MRGVGPVPSPGVPHRRNPLPAASYRGKVGGMATTTNPREVKPGDRIRLVRLATPDPHLVPGMTGTVLDVTRTETGAPAVVIVAGWPAAILADSGDRFEIDEAASGGVPAGWSR